MNQFWKAVRPDGTDFYTGMVQWAPPEDHEGDWIVRHPTAAEIGDRPSEYLSVAAVPTDCTGMTWPCRLLTVEAVGDVIAPSPVMPNKRAGIVFRVTGERPAHEALGPQGEHVAALIDRASRLIIGELDDLDATWVIVRYAASSAASSAKRFAKRSAAYATADDAAYDAAYDVSSAARWVVSDATLGLVVRDLISTDHYDTLTRPWRTVVGSIHPDDEPLKP